MQTPPLWRGLFFLAPPVINTKVDLLIKMPANFISSTFAV
jgi:hypothetical protein